MYLGPHFLHQLFSLTDILSLKLLYFSLYIHFFFFPFNKIFAVTGSLIQLPFPPNPGNRRTFQRGQDGAAGWATSRCCSRAEVSTQLPSACSHLQELPLLQGLLELCFAIFILQINSGVLHSDKGKQKLALFSSDNLTEKWFLFPDFYSILGIYICLWSL